jgi:hypothetical protein
MTAQSNRKESDVELGRRVGAATILLATESPRGRGSAADHIVATLEDAARLVVYEK